MAAKRIHIVSFQVPYPADSGGVIDVYYKAKALKDAGYNVVLHSYAYHGRENCSELQEIADEVYTYKRKTGLRSLLSFTPYIVNSRKSDELLKDLIKDDAPILFEGAHTTALLSSPLLKGRKKFVRTHNVESEYYRELARASTSPFKKLFFIMESWKLKRYEPELKDADILFTITDKEKKTFESICPGTKVELLPCFHNGLSSEVAAEDIGKGGYILYNGNLCVDENIKAALFLINEVAVATEGTKWIIAGNTPAGSLYEAAERAGNVEIIANPTNDEMTRLITGAAVNILTTFQATGIKLKLLGTLYKGGYCIVNDKMIESTGLDALCTIANTPIEMRDAIIRLTRTEISTEEIAERRKVLFEKYDNNRNITILTSHL
ncbi:MAG: glycosyltransferase family 4 protein [Bacteroidales bacterium]|nr:glycosyltransferase family 4 protein [Bacteroidales bacterium]